MNVRFDHGSFPEYLWDCKWTWLPQTPTLLVAVYLEFNADTPWIRWLMVAVFVLWVIIFMMMASTYYHVIKPHQKRQYEFADHLLIKALEMEKLADDYTVPSPIRDYRMDLAKMLRTHAEEIRKNVTPRRVAAKQQE